MDAFVFNAHQDDPHVRVPVDLCFLCFLYDAYNHLLDSVPVGFGVFDGRPFVMGLAEIIPIHLVNTDCEHPFVGFVDPCTD